jgi:hypothetical protein
MDKEKARKLGILQDKKQEKKPAPKPADNG